MADPAFYEDRDSFSTAMEEYSVLKTTLPRLEHEWLELTQEIEEFESKQDVPGNRL